MYAYEKPGRRQETQPATGYNMTQSDRKRDHDHERGVAILTRKDTNVKPIPLNTNLQPIATRV